MASTLLSTLSSPAPPSGRSHPPAPVPPDDQRLRALARELEASFLAVMLKSAGLGEPREAFGGGAGEDQFTSMLTTEHARALAERGGIGLAETLFEAMKEQRDGKA
ncbi:rod-binding protein [Palleronia sp. KMU-117]|uniref:rod-binding protein n=1 Tax=Palleronia sp. KMU-117 TaxID=3434108 RepID=UPI003D728CD1